MKLSDSKMSAVFHQIWQQLDNVVTCVHFSLFVDNVKLEISAIANSDRHRHFSLSINNLTDDS